MGLFSRFFGGGARPSDTPGTPADAIYEHPVLGTFLMEADDDWLNEEATIPGLGDGLSLHLTGDASGPSAAALQACDWLLQDVGQIWEPIQGDLFDLYETYAEHHASPVVCKGPADIRTTAEVVGLSLRSTLDYDVTMTFLWQDPKDDHIVTAYVEGGQSQGHSVDG